MAPIFTTRRRPWRSRSIVLAIGSVVAGYVEPRRTASSGFSSRASRCRRRTEADFSRARTWRLDRARNHADGGVDASSPSPASASRCIFFLKKREAADRVGPAVPRPAPRARAQVLRRRDLRRGGRPADSHRLRGRTVEDRRRARHRRRRQRRRGRRCAAAASFSAVCRPDRCARTRRRCSSAW